MHLPKKYKKIILEMPKKIFIGRGPDVVCIILNNVPDRVNASNTQRMTIGVNCVNLDLTFCGT